MAVEFQILDWIQNIRTPAGRCIHELSFRSWGMPGILWIVTAVVLAVIPSEPERQGS